MNVYVFLATCVVLCGIKVTRITCSIAGPVTFFTATFKNGQSQTHFVTTPKSDNFVEVIKKDLKRDNDDYKEHAVESGLVTLRPSTGAVQVAVKSIPVSHDNNNRVQIKSNTNGYRRFKGQSYEMYDFLVQSPITENKSTGSVVTKPVHRIRKLSPGLNFLPNIKNHSISQKLNGVPSNQKPFPNFVDSLKQNQQMTTPQVTSQNKIDKFKQFMKNKKLFKQFINNKEEQTQKVELRQNFARPNKQKNVANIGVKNKDGELPNPEQLDMAPARGGRIYRHRLKGRLCHRHVLMPEGPKYDSAGQWYVPAREQRPGAGGDYARTRPPALLLPRCCNCCKKSVLGCQ